MAGLCQLCGFYISVKSYHIFRRVQHLAYGSKLLKVKYQVLHVSSLHLQWNVYMFFINCLHPHWKTKIISYCCVCWQSPFTQYLKSYVALDHQFSSVQLLSHVWLFMTPWTAAHQASLSITNSRGLPKLMSIELVMHPNISSSVIPFSSCRQSFPASGSFLMSLFFSTLHVMWPTYCSFNFSIHPAKEYTWRPSYISPSDELIVGHWVCIRELVGVGKTHSWSQKCSVWM